MMASTSTGTVKRRVHSSIVPVRRARATNVPLAAAQHQRKLVTCRSLQRTIIGLKLCKLSHVHHECNATALRSPAKVRYDTRTTRRPAICCTGVRFHAAAKNTPSRVQCTAATNCCQPPWELRHLCMVGRPCTPLSLQPTAPCYFRVLSSPIPSPHRPRLIASCTGRVPWDMHGYHIFASRRVARCRAMCSRTRHPPATNGCRRQHHPSCRSISK